MSKSLGNVIAPQEIIKQYGADVLRLWVAMSDYREDVRLSQDIVKHMVDIYRRFRNVFRFLLQNTADFKWDQHAVAVKDMPEMDRWLVNAFEELRFRMVEKNYADHQFQIVGAEINRFMSNELSGFYLDAVKDPLYCDDLNSRERRSVQTALAIVARGLTVLLAPIISFTAEEAYGELRKTSWPDLLESVFLDEFKNLKVTEFDPALHAKWAEIIAIRSRVNEELDKKRKEGSIKSSQEAAVAIGADVARHGAIDWLFVLQMAEVRFTGGEAIAIEKTAFKKCERCWRHRPDVGSHHDHATLCSRCRDVVSKLPAGV
jgi:isoleucyl-tRNA synthetase